MTVTIDTSFIGKFKTGDNLVYTAKVLQQLYLDDSALLIKPKVIQNASLVEAVLYDFFRRICDHTSEFNYLDSKTLAEIRSTKPENIANFESHINKFGHYQLLGKCSDLYKDLHTLRKLRNRIHVQNEKGVFDPDDGKTFTKDKLILSEKCAEYVLRYLSTKYPRNKKHVKDINLPWCAHFNDDLTPRQ